MGGLIAFLASLVIAIFPVHKPLVRNITPTPSPSSTPIKEIIKTSPKPAIVKPIVSTISTPNTQDCIIGGQVLQLTFTDCQKRLDEEIAKSEQNINNLPTPQQFMDQTTTDIQQYYKDHPIPTSPSLVIPTPQPVTPEENPTLVEPTPDPLYCSNLSREIGSTQGQIEANDASAGISGGLDISRQAQGTSDLCFQMKENNCDHIQSICSQ